MFDHSLFYWPRSNIWNVSLFFFLAPRKTKKKNKTHTSTTLSLVVFHTHDIWYGRSCVSLRRGALYTQRPAAFVMAAFERRRRRQRFFFPTWCNNVIHPLFSFFFSGSIGSDRWSNYFHSAIFKHFKKRTNKYILTWSRAVHVVYRFQHEGEGPL